MIRKTIQTGGIVLVWTTAVTICAVAFSTYYVVNRLYIPEEKAFFIEDLKIEKEIVEPGEIVKFNQIATRSKSCPSIIASFWVDENGKPVVRFPPITGGYTSVGEHYNVQFDVPAPMTNTITGTSVPPGRYRYVSVNAPLCPNLVATETPPVWICLKVEGKPIPKCAEPGYDIQKGDEK